MKNSMQLKAIIKKYCKRETYISTARNAEFYVGEIIRTDICFKVSEKFYSEGWIFDCCNGGS